MGMNIITYLGGPSRVAKALRISVQAVSQWEGRVPADKVLPLVRAVHGAVTPYELRPDLYPDPDWMPPGVARAAAQEGA